MLNFMWISISVYSIIVMEINKSAFRESLILQNKHIRGGITETNHINDGFLRFYVYLYWKIKIDWIFVDNKSKESIIDLTNENHEPMKLTINKLFRWLRVEVNLSVYSCANII